MEQFFKSFLVLVLTSTLLSAGIKFGINYNDDTRHISENTVVQLTSDALDLENNDALYFRATVNVYSGDGVDKDYFVVYLFRSDSYLAEVYRLDIDGSKVAGVIQDYVEESSDEELCGTCPDPDVEVLISYIEDALFPGSIQHGWGTYQMALGEGLNTVLLIGHRETKSKVLNYLACPKLEVWGRIGHGTKNGVTFNDYQGSLTANDVEKIADDIEGKTFIFNSCLLHNPPFEPAMIDAGAYFFAGGDISLSGGKEAVFSKFFTKAIKQKMELTKAMDEAISETNYHNAWGYSGNGGPPYYLTFGVSDISNTVSDQHNNFSILVTSDMVFFNYGAPLSKISIFNPVGKLIYRDNLLQGKNSWNMATSTGQNVPNGNYIAVIENQTGSESVKKAFTIIK
jgi:hypothetical protein